MRAKQSGSYQTGLLAEMLAAWFLRLKGYRIVAQRFKTPVGEIDLIARRGDVLVFVEVKAREKMDDALAALQGRQMTRLTRAAQWYMGSGQQTATQMRFDVVAVVLPLTIKHIQAAFTA